MHYYRMKQIIEIDVIVKTENREEAEILSNCIRATFENEEGKMFPENGNPLVSFESDSDMTTFDLFECNKDGDPLEIEENE